MNDAPCESRAGGLRAARPHSQAWLAAYTRPRYEEKVTEFCQAHGLDVFWPCYKSWRRWSDRRKLMTLPLFPSYVFLRANEMERQRAVQAPGFLCYVHNRQGPIRVDDGELSVIRRALASGLELDPLPHVQLGDEVEVVSGAMRGCRGRLLRKDSTAIVLVVTAIQGSIKVSLPDASWLRRCEVSAHGPCKVPARSSFPSA